MNDNVRTAIFRYVKTTAFHELCVFGNWIGKGADTETVAKAFEAAKVEKGIEEANMLEDAARLIKNTCMDFRKRCHSKFFKETTCEC